MRKKSLPRLLREPWGRCDDLVYALGMRSVEDIKKKLGNKRFDDISSFLRDIGFLVDEKLSDIGEEYYKSKYILNDEKTANKILANMVRQYTPTQAMCQLLWGRSKLNRTSVYRLLVFEKYIDPNEFAEEDLGSFFMLLNQCEIMRYSKKTNEVTILYNPHTTETPRPLSRFLSPETPYSNLRNLWEVFRSCTGFIHWFDKHFSAKGLEPLADEADGTKVNEIKILTAVVSRGVNERLRRDFVRFREEMKVRGIHSELRVICNKDLLNDIHDRWIISEKVCFNVPPVDSIFKGQYSELKETKNRPPFGEWWQIGLDLLTDWQSIAR